MKKRTKRTPNIALRAVRDESGISQAELARLTGTSQQDIARIEAGREPRVGMAIVIAKVLGVRVDVIFQGKVVRETR